MSGMARFEKADSSTSQVEYIHALYPFLNLDPIYQRESGVWSKERKQLFIDSLINGFDVPKIYLNKVDYSEEIDGEEKLIRYEVIDGKQRIESIEEFLNDSYPLSDTFHLIDDEDSVGSGGLFYSELVSNNPEVVYKLLHYSFDIVVLDHQQEDFVDEFFIRLNGGEPLNAQEKRNACSCDLRTRVKKISSTDKFVKKCLVPRSRYKNDELVAKFFSIADQFGELGKITDIKKNRLDRLYERSKNNELTSESLVLIESRVKETLTLLYRVFGTPDPLIRSVGNVVVYFISAFTCPELWVNASVKEYIRSFEKLRKDIVNNDFEIMTVREQTIFMICDEYNSYVQSANDGSALSWRSCCINCFIRAKGDFDDFYLLMSPFLY